MRELFHQTSEAAIVIATLLIAALFQPLRKCLQAVIDRRFYHSKYDAARTMAAFSATLRHEVDLDWLREELVAVVQETSSMFHWASWFHTVTSIATWSERLISRSCASSPMRPGGSILELLRRHR